MLSLLCQLMESPSKKTIHEQSRRLLINNITNRRLKNAQSNKDGDMQRNDTKRRMKQELWIKQNRRKSKSTIEIRCQRLTWE